jgi:hypothetical protein
MNEDELGELFIFDENNWVELLPGRNPGGEERPVRGVPEPVCPLCGHRTDDGEPAVTMTVAEGGARLVYVLRNGTELVQPDHGWSVHPACVETMVAEVGIRS